MAFAGIACTALTGTLFAAQDLHSTDTDSDQQPKVITPNAGPRVQDGADVFFTADFIYWSVREEGLNFANTGYAAGGTAVSTLSRGSTYAPSFTWRPGFKVGMGLQMAHDGWDVTAEYTWLNNGTRSKSVTNPTTATYDLTPTFIIDPINTYVAVDTASGSWKSNFNTADLDLGRQYFISHYLILRPFAGLKASWQKQNYNVTYGTTTGSTTTYERSASTERFFGIGLHTGMDAAFQFDQNWSMYGDFAISALASHFNLSQTATTYNVTGTTTTASNYLGKYKAIYNTITPVLELGMGLRWDYWFNDDSYHVGLSLGWEQQLWWNMNRFATIMEPGYAGNLSMQGVTFKFRFDF